MEDDRSLQKPRVLRVKKCFTSYSLNADPRNPKNVTSKKSTLKGRITKKINLLLDLRLKGEA